MSILGKLEELFEEIEDFRETCKQIEESLTEDYAQEYQLV